MLDNELLRSYRGFKAILDDLFLLSSEEDAYSQKVLHEKAIVIQKIYRGYKARKTRLSLESQQRDLRRPITRRFAERLQSDPHQSDNSTNNNEDPTRIDYPTQYGTSLSSSSNPQPNISLLQSPQEKTQNIHNKSTSPPKEDASNLNGYFNYYNNYQASGSNPTNRNNHPAAQNTRTTTTTRMNPLHSGITSSLSLKQPSPISSGINYKYDMGNRSLHRESYPTIQLKSNHNNIRNSSSTTNRNRRKVELQSADESDLGDNVPTITSYESFGALTSSYISPHHPNPHPLNHSNNSHPNNNNDHTVSNESGIHSNPMDLEENNQNTLKPNKPLRKQQLESLQNQLQELKEKRKNTHTHTNTSTHSGGGNASDRPLRKSNRVQPFHHDGEEDDGDDRYLSTRRTQKQDNVIQINNFVDTTGISSLFGVLLALL